MTRIFFGALALLTLLFSAPSNAADTILTIDGLSAKTANGPVTFDLAEFEAIGMTDIETKTPWHETVTTFSGVSGNDLVSFLGVTGTEMDAVALNDYKITIPVSDLRETGLILATRKNGTPMSVRDKGPVFIIYPFDANPKLDNEVFYGRSIWQLKELRFR